MIIYVLPCKWLMVNTCEYWIYPNRWKIDSKKIENILFFGDLLWSGSCQDDLSIVPLQQKLQDALGNPAEGVEQFMGMRREDSEGKFKLRNMSAVQSMDKQ